MRYFNTFPLVNYNDVLVRNIVARVKVFEKAKHVDTIFYKYKVKDGERPDVIAYNYYGDSQYFWAIFIVNDIVDPYYEWPMSQRTFNRFLIAKYGNIATAQATILKYRKIDTAYYLHNTRPDVIITATDYASLSAAEKNNYTQQDQDDNVFVSNETYALMSGPDLAAFEPVYAYDFEVDANEARREIKLLNLTYISRIEEDLKRLMLQ